MKPRNKTSAEAHAIRIKVLLQQLPHSRGLPLPAYQTAGSAGIDLPAAVDATQPTILKPGERALIPTGLALEIPTGYEAQVRPRSGLAMRHGITVLNSPGTIDSDYRGEIKVLLINLGTKKFAIARGERIAQLVLAPVSQANLINVVSLRDSERGTGGFGSTGTTTGATKRKTKRITARKMTSAKSTAGKPKKTARKTAKRSAAKSKTRTKTKTARRTPRKSPTTKRAAKKKAGARK